MRVGTGLGVCGELDDWLELEGTCLGGVSSSSVTGLSEELNGCGLSLYVKWNMELWAVVDGLHVGGLFGEDLGGDDSWPVECFGMGLSLDTSCWSPLSIPLGPKGVAHIFGDPPWSLLHSCDKLLSLDPGPAGVLKEGVNSSHDKGMFVLLENFGIFLGGCSPSLLESENSDILMTSSSNLCGSQLVSNCATANTYRFSP